MKKSNFATLLMACTILSACSYSLAPKSGSHHLLVAQDHIAAGETQAAKSSFASALATSKRRDIQAEAIAGIANIDRQNKNYTAYIENLEQAADLNPDRYTEKLAQAYKKYGTTEQILTAKALFHERSETSANANLALADLVMNDNANTISHYIQKARTLLKLKDSAGNALKMARTYHTYESIEPDFEKAEYWYRQAIEKGDENGVFELGEMWVENNLRNNAKADAFTLIQQSADRGHLKSIRYIANAYAEGIGVEQDQYSAIAWYEKLLPFNDTKAYRYLAGAYVRELPKNSQSLPSNLIDIYTDYHALGGKNTELILAVWDGRTHLLESLDDKAINKQIRNLEKAWGQNQPHLIKTVYNTLADEDIMSAILYVAEGYDKGINGFEKNHDKAMTYFQKAAKAGDATGLLKYAHQYANDPNDTKALAKALRYYKKAADAGNGEGQYQTGLMYARGIGIEKDIKKAKKWLELATDNGYPLALKILESVE